MISVRVPWDLLSRLQARAIARGVDRSEAIKQAIEAWVASDPTPRPPAEIDLVNLVARTAKVPRSVARMYIQTGRVYVNGTLTTALTLPPGRYETEVRQK